MSTLAAGSYGLTAAAFVVLTLLLSTSWRGHRQGGYLIMACLATAGWAVTMALEGTATATTPVAYTAEMLRNGAWLMVLTRVGRPVLPFVLRTGVHVLWAALFVFGLVRARGTVDSASVDPSFTFAGICIALVALVLLEQIYRNSNQATRRSLKYFVLGVGVIFAFELFFHVQAELLLRVSVGAWIARGVIDAMAVPLLAVAVRRNPDWSLDIFVSRQVVFYTATFLAVGVYLLLMAGGAWYVREIGGTWGGVMQALFLAGSLLALFALLLSGRWWRRVRVFIAKHFYRNKYDYRIEWLRFSRTLGAITDEDVRRTSIEAVAQIFSSPGGLLFTAVDEERRFVLAATWPMHRDAMVDMADLPGDSSLVHFLEHTQWVIDLVEYRRNPGRYKDLELPPWLLAHPHLRIITPVLEPKRLAAFFILYEPPAPFELTYEDRDLLKTAGRQVAAHIAQHDANRRLAESRQFEAYNRLTAFLMHDLKNSVAQLQLVVTNASRHKRNPEFIDDAIETIASTVERMTRLIEQLRGGASSSRMQPVVLNELISHAVARCAARAPLPAFEVDEQPVTVRADPERLTCVLEHVIRNAQEATPESGRVTVGLRTAAGEVSIVVEDTGCGMPPEFIRERLFQPFDSTKGAKGMGIGAYQVREYVRMLGGRVEVQSIPSKGTMFAIMLPRAQE